MAVARISLISCDPGEVMTSYCCGAKKNPGRRQRMKMNQNLFFRSSSQSGLKKYAALPLRLIVGYGFVAHGMAKWAKGPEAFGTILQAAQVPVPHVMAWLTILTEIFGGLAILLGAFVALVSIPTIVLLIVAIVTVHLPYGFTSIKLVGIVDGRAQFGPPGYECDLLYIACIVTLVLCGPSPWSVDAYRLRKEGGALL